MAYRLLSDVRTACESLNDAHATNCMGDFSMGLQDFILVILFGLVTSGLGYSLWPLVFGRQVTMALFWCDDVAAPLRAIVVLVCAPVLLTRAGYTQLTTRASQFLWAPTFATALALCFIQGVVVVVCLGLAG